MNGRTEYDPGGAPTVLIVDNGSTRPAATLSLRSIAGKLTERLQRVVHPVSLQHADRISADALDGHPADVFPAFIDRQLANGERRFWVLPLFFGNSRALTSFIPQQASALAEAHGDFELRVAAPLSPMPDGEPLLTRILLEHTEDCLADGPDPGSTAVIVVDHGSPLREVTAVRERVGAALRSHYGDRLRVAEAAMERRHGRQYDFAGVLLTDALDAAAEDGRQRVVVAMMFISPGSHAGPGGDIAEICADAMARHPGLDVRVSPLVGEHPLLIEILAARLDDVARGDAAQWAPLAAG